jgi:uncharacterized membrane protein
MQINTILIEVNRSMNAKHMSIIAVAALAAMLIASTALSTADNAFADKKKKKTSYEKTQATYQANDCGNGDTPIDVFCQNLESQIQGDGNAVAIILEQR